MRMDAEPWVKPGAPCACLFPRPSWPFSAAHQELLSGWLGCLSPVPRGGHGTRTPGWPFSTGSVLRACGHTSLFTQGCSGLNILGGRETPDHPLAFVQNWPECGIREPRPSSIAVLLQSRAWPRNTRPTQLVLLPGPFRREASCQVTSCIRRPTWQRRQRSPEPALEG